MRTGLINHASVYSPFDRLADIRREMDRVFEGATAGSVNGASYWVPPMDVTETTDHIECQIEVPGIDPEQIEIRLENGRLTIAGEKKSAYSGGAEDGVVRHLERGFGRFERSLTLPRVVDGQRIRAVHENGVLMIVLPKAEEARARRIAIERTPVHQRFEDTESQS